MTKTNFGRKLAATLSGPLLAAGILAGSMVIGGSAIAGAQPTTDSQCSSMTMTNGQDGTAPNRMTRAGQVGAAAGPSASDGSMAVNCQAASHG